MPKPGSGVPHWEPEGRRRSAHRHGRTSMAVASRARVALCGNAACSGSSEAGGQKNSGTCATAQARCQPSLESTTLREAIPAR